MFAFWFWLRGAFAWAIAEVGTVIGAKAAVRLVAAGAISAAALAIIAAINLGMSALITALPTPVQIGASWIIPSNLAPCAALYLSTVAGIWVFNFVNSATFGVRL